MILTTPRVQNLTAEVNISTSDAAFITEDYACIVVTDHLISNISVRDFICGSIMLSAPKFSELYSLLVDCNGTPIYDSDGNAIYMRR